jgi:hypothetical protein
MMPGARGTIGPQRLHQATAARQIVALGNEGESSALAKMPV